MEFNYSFNPDGVNAIIDEQAGSNTFIALREIRWNDTDNYRLDLRKYIMKPDGTEFAGKGVSFMTPNGPHVLTNKLIEAGYGNIEKIVKTFLDTRRVEFIDSIAATSGMSEDEFSEFIRDAQVYYDCHNENKQSAKDMLDGIFSKKD